MYFRGEEFRKDFKDLSAVRAFFPTAPIMALTATAPPQLLTNLKQSLSLKTDCKVIAANPNRSNIYFDKKLRMSSHHGYDGFNQILLPIANDLAMQREKYPMTIIYLKLKYCGYAYALFERMLQDKQFVGETKDPAGRLFAQFHAPQRNRMKKSIISEIKEENSRIRVLFATSALGMGVNAPYVQHIIHISPPSNLEAYMQETGRAGRTGMPAWATLCYNKADIASNKEHIQEPMKAYCRAEESCLRTLILKYLGFPGVTQQRCCCVCDGKCSNVVANVPETVKPRLRTMPADSKTVLNELISSELRDFEAQSNFTSLMLFSISNENNLLQKIMEGIEYIEKESDLLNTYGIWDETYSSKIFSFITQYAPLIQGETSDIGSMA